MSAVIIETKDELISAIKERIISISGSDEVRTVNLENVQFHESDRTAANGRMYITCIFINEDNNVCADMYRSGAACCVDFICGLDLKSVDEKNLKQILSALDKNICFDEDAPVIAKQKKRNLVSALKIPFLQKGA